MKIIILAGGIGSRLWPLSRSDFPKQFSTFGREHSLLQQTFLRFLEVFSPEDLVIVTQKELVHLVKLQANAIDPRLTKRIIVEPERRNTAPAILFALKWLQARGELDECFLVAPSDHVIQPTSIFLEKVQLAEKTTREGFHVVFGVSASHPHTGYGYIQYEGNDVKQFIEKPQQAKAESLLMTGNCLWNAGIFVFQTALFFEELKLHQSEMSEAFHADIEENFSLMPSLSIDYALLEESHHLKVIPLHLTWSDVGSWDSVYELSDKDSAQNVTKGEVAVLNTKRSLILGGKRLIAAVDVEDMMIIDTEDALLIANKGSSQKVRALVQQLDEKKEVHEHRTTYRPWGSYTILEEAEGVKIKHIIVNPKQKLSLQYHFHRSEHWVVIKGLATILLGDEELTLEENESLFVPKEKPHRLENTADVPLEIIEVQVGTYVGEDDIVRLDDVYGRIEKTSSKI